MTNEDVAQELEEIADLLEIADANVFRVRSFRRAVESIAELSEEVSVLLGEGRLTDVPGIGKGIAKIIEELVNTGTSEDKEACLRNIRKACWRC